MASTTGDAVLDWNAVLLQANANDFDPNIVASPDQRGPTRSSRAFAIVHAAIYDAVNSIDRSFMPYLAEVRAPRGASIEAAVAQAAHDTLVALYPQQRGTFDAALAQYLRGIPPWRARQGRAVGAAAARNILAARANDGSKADMSYEPIPLPGYHQVDPLHPNQGFLDPRWGQVTSFTLGSAAQFRAADFVGGDPQARLAWLNSPDYRAAFEEVRAIGRKRSEVRTHDQTEIAIFWAYDGSPGLGTPQRLHNQIARTIATLMGNTEIENARLFALINLAQGDAGISTWETKYFYQFWRPIVAIRATCDPTWEPLGAPADNNSGTNFTPNFPSYVSGHACFGSSMFQTLRRYYGTDDIAFSFQSDEFNGVTRDDNGRVRPPRTRSYSNLTQAEMENHDSRIYLGIHWRFDQDQGLIQGRSVANYIFDNFLQPR
jgi:hypothetical protein